MTEDACQDCHLFRQHMQRFSMVFTTGISNILGRGGINLPQYNAMSLLMTQGDMKMGEMAKQMGVTMGAATNLADKLVECGTVSRARDAKDRRVVRLALTAKGKRQVEEIEQTFVNFCTRVMGQIDGETRKQFLATFGLVLDMMQKAVETSQQGQ